MNQSQITNLRNSLSERVRVLALDKFPESKIPSADHMIAESLVSGAVVKIRSLKELKALALKKIVSSGYHSNRHFELSEIFETSEEITKAQKAQESLTLAREKFRTRLVTLLNQVILECKIGKFDPEPSAALESFEDRATSIK